MANSTQYTKALAGSPKLDTNELTGKIRVAYADFTFDGASAGCLRRLYL